MLGHCNSPEMYWAILTLLKCAGALLNFWNMLGCCRTTELYWAHVTLLNCTGLYLNVCDTNEVESTQTCWIFPTIPLSGTLNRVPLGVFWNTWYKSKPKLNLAWNSHFLPLSWNIQIVFETKPSLTCNFSLCLKIIETWPYLGQNWTVMYKWTQKGPIGSSFG